jgi:hypothetical protein
MYLPSSGVTTRVGWTRRLYIRSMFFIWLGLSPSRFPYACAIDLISLKRYSVRENYITGAFKNNYLFPCRGLIKRSRPGGVFEHGSHARAVPYAEGGLLI